MNTWDEPLNPEALFDESWHEVIIITLISAPLTFFRKLPDVKGRMQYTRHVVLFWFTRADYPAVPVLWLRLWWKQAFIFDIYTRRLVVELLKSYFGAHVLHSRQRQLSQVSVLHSRAHQRHGDVPDGKHDMEEAHENGHLEVWILSSRVVLNMSWLLY